LRKTPSSNDDATAKQLQLLVGLVVVLALCTSAAIGWYVIRHPWPVPNVAVVALVYLTMVLANKFQVYVRIRSTLDGTTWAEIPIIVGLVLIPLPWVVLCAATALLTVKIINRIPPQKTIYSVAKDIVVTSAAGGALLAAGVHPSLHSPQLNILGLSLAYLALWLVDDLLFVPVIAVASGTPIGRVARRDLAGRIITHAGRLATIVYVVAILALDANLFLLAFVPLVVICLHLWQSRRLSTREERSSWQQLAHTIDELSSVDLTQVLHVAAGRATGIFSADEVEIDMTSDGVDRVVRANATGIVYDGPGPRKFQVSTSITAELETSDHSYRAGVLVLGFHGRVRLNEFEKYKFKTYASALCTAIRNASAYAELQRISAENAHQRRTTR